MKQSRSGARVRVSSLAGVGAGVMAGGARAHKGERE